MKVHERGKDERWANRNEPHGMAESDEVGCVMFTNSPRTASVLVNDKNVDEYKDERGDGYLRPDKVEKYEERGMLLINTSRSTGLEKGTTFIGIGTGEQGYDRRSINSKHCAIEEHRRMKICEEYEKVYNEIPIVVVRMKRNVQQVDDVQIGKQMKTCVTK